MMDQILFFNIDSLAKFLSGSKRNLDIMYIFRIVTKFRKTSVKVLSHLAGKCQDTAICFNAVVNLKCALNCQHSLTNLSSSLTLVGLCYL